MKKSSLILVGFIFILLLASLTFSTVSDRIKDDLLEKTKQKFYEKGINDIHVEMEGEGLTLSRNLIVTGSVYSETQKSYIVALLEDIYGVSSVDNQIVVTSPNYYKPTLDVNGQVAGIEPFKPLAQENVEKTTLKTEEVNAEVANRNQKQAEQEEVVDVVKAMEVSSQELPEVTQPKKVEMSAELANPEKPIDVVKAMDTSSQILPTVSKPQEAETSQKPVAPQEVIETTKTVNVPSNALPEVVKPIDASSIKVSTPIPSTVEVPQATEIETIYEERQTLKKGEE